MEQLSFFEDQSRPNMPFADLAELYFTHYAEQNLKASTRANYRYIADRFLLPAFGAIPLSAFNNLMLTRWFADLPVSPSYCKNIYTALRSMFTLAIHHGFIPTHPCDYVVLPRRPVDAEERSPRLTEAKSSPGSLPSSASCCSPASAPARPSASAGKMWTSNAR